jgi:RHS repeat-associated protein
MTTNNSYDLIGEVGTSGSLVRSYLWGNDLSGSQQAAGGMGGLLEVTYYGTQTTNCFAAYDGNGNLSGLVNAADGTMVARYEYGPFGEVIRATGPMSKVNPFRFSTKYQDDETDLVYYGYRYYNPSTGRWLSGDPIGEDAFYGIYCGTKTDEEKISLRWERLAPTYNFISNEGINGIDSQGLDRWHVDRLHTYVVVEVWDRCCQKVIGYKRIEYGPKNGWAFIPPFFTGPGEVTISDTSKPTEGLLTWRIPSCCSADNILLSWAQDMQKNPTVYNFWVFNCRHFSAYAQNVGLGSCE